MQSCEYHIKWGGCRGERGCANERMIRKRELTCYSSPNQRFWPLMFGIISASSRNRDRNRRHMRLDELPERQVLRRVFDMAGRTQRIGIVQIRIKISPWFPAGKNRPPRSGQTAALILVADPWSRKWEQPPVKTAVYRKSYPELCTPIGWSLSESFFSGILPGRIRSVAEAFSLLGIFPNWWKWNLALHCIWFFCSNFLRRETTILGSILPKNPIDREAWWVTVQRVAKSRPWTLSTHTSGFKHFLVDRHGILGYSSKSEFQLLHL